MLGRSRGRSRPQTNEAFMHHKSSMLSDSSDSNDFEDAHSVINTLQQKMLVNYFFLTYF